MSDISQAGLPDATTASLTDKATGLQSGASKNLPLGVVKQLFDTPVINSQATGYTLADTDHGTVIEINSSTPVTVTVPSGLRIRFTCIIVQMGTGLVTIIAGAGANTRGGSAMGGQYASAVVMGRALNDFYVFTGAASGTIGGTTALNAPVLSAGSPGATSVPLTWTDTNSSPNESSFEIQVSTDGGTTWGAATTGTAAANATGVTEAGLSSSTAYKFRVRAVGNGTTTSTSVWSNVVSITTAASGPSLVYLNWPTQVAPGSFTESPAHTFGTTGGNIGVADKKILAGNSGYVIWDISDANCNYVAVALSPNNTAANWNDANFTYGFGTFAATYARFISGAYTDLSTAMATGDKLRVNKVVSGGNMTITFERSTDGGTTWTTMYTAASAVTDVDLFIKTVIDVNGSASAAHLVNAQVYNGS